MSCFKVSPSVEIPIGSYINDLRSCDEVLSGMIAKNKNEYVRLGKMGKTLHIARRRLMVKKHIERIENRRNQILGRILQLESIHIDKLQIDALKNISNAYSGVKTTVGDVDALLDKIESFKDDFDDVRDRLNESFDIMNTEINDDEIEKELHEMESTLNQSLPEVPSFVPQVLKNNNNNSDSEIETTTADTNAIAVAFVEQNTENT